MHWMDQEFKSPVLSLIVHLFSLGISGSTGGKESTFKAGDIKEMRVQSLDQEDALEKGTTGHSIILAWRIPWAEEPGGLRSVGSQRVGQDWSDLARTNTHGSLLYYQALSCHVSLLTESLWIHSGCVCWEGETRHTKALRTLHKPRRNGFQLSAGTGLQRLLAWAGVLMPVKKTHSLVPALLCSAQGLVD